jgi:hypothetical protein
MQANLIRRMGLWALLAATWLVPASARATAIADSTTPFFTPGVAPGAGWPSLPSYATDFTWHRGDANTTYQEWDVFQSTTAPNSPDVGVFNPNGTPTARDASGLDASSFPNDGAFLTSGGNIYSFSAPIQIALDLPNYGKGAAGWSTTIVLQIQTAGNPLDPSSIALTPLGGSALLPLDGGTRTFSGSTGSPFGGNKDDWFFEWHVDGNASSYALTFKASDASMSLDRISVDTLTTFTPAVAPTPEPSSLVSATLGLLVAGGWWGLRRRRRVAFLGA